MGITDEEVMGNMNVRLNGMAGWELLRTPWLAWGEACGASLIEWAGRERGDGAPCYRCWDGLIPLSQMCIEIVRCK